MSVIEVLAAYILVDALIGVYHWATDNGWNTPDMVRKFQEHHTDPRNMTEFDWQPMPPGLVFLGLGWWLQSSFVMAFGAFLVLAQVPHYYAHRRSTSAVVHRILRFLQVIGLIASPESHALHHDGVFNRNFCVLSGWNNWWLNWIVRSR